MYLQAWVRKTSFANVYSGRMLLIRHGKTGPLYKSYDSEQHKCIWEIGECRTQGCSHMPESPPQGHRGQGQLAPLSSPKKKKRRQKGGRVRGRFCQDSVVSEKAEGLGPRSPASSPGPHQPEALASTSSTTTQSHGTFSPHKQKIQCKIPENLLTGGPLKGCEWLHSL